MHFDCFPASAVKKLRVNGPYSDAIDAQAALFCFSLLQPMRAPSLKRPVTKPKSHCGWNFLSKIPIFLQRFWLGGKVLRTFSRNELLAETVHKLKKHLKLKKNLLLIFIIIISSNLFGQEKIFGYYSSNVAELGFFVTKIRLNKNYTFEYEFSGDLIHQSGKGKFEIIDKNVILLKFDNEQENEKNVAELLSSGNTKIENKKYKYNNGKLFPFHLDGYVVKRGQAFSRHKKYLFWGERYMTKRRIYLKKRTE